MNVPLRDGIDDGTFQRIFQPVMRKVMEMYKPGAIVLQVREANMKSHRRYSKVLVRSTKRKITLTPPLPYYTTRLCRSAERTPLGTTGWAASLFRWTATRTACGS